MKKILSIILIVVCLFSLPSCAIIPAYDGDELKRILGANGYEIEEGHDVDHQGVDGYIYAHKADDELYYIYCKNFATTKAIYRYIKGNLDIKIADLKVQIEEVEWKLEYSDASALEKGVYYSEYLLLKEELAEAQKYGYGRGINVVWYGTKQAIKDIRFGE